MAETKEIIARDLLRFKGLNDDFYFDNKDSKDGEIQRELSSAILWADVIEKDIERNQPG